MEVLVSKPKKITLATFKKFIRDNKDNLYIDVRTSFDGMVDCVTSVKSAPSKVVFTNENIEHTCGISGAWLVGSSRDYFKAIEDEVFKGIQVSNCCGSFNLTIIK